MAARHIATSALNAYAQKAFSEAVAAMKKQGADGQ